MNAHPLSPARSSRPTSSPRRVAARLNAEWARLVTSRRTAPVPAAWRRRPELAAYGTLEELLAATGRDAGNDDATADGVLAAVVACAAHDELAARLVLQRVAAGLVMTAIRRSRRGAWELQELFDDLVAHCWLVIRTYPLARRPVKIAVNILRDTEYLSCVRPYRLRRVVEEPSGLTRLADRPADLEGRSADTTPHAADEVVLMLRELRRAGLAPADVRLLWQIHVEGGDAAELAAELHVCERTVRNRRDAAVSRARGLLVA